MAADMVALHDLMQRVQVGWRVETTNHDSITESRNGTITHLVANMHGSGKPGFLTTLDKVVRNQGRASRTSYMLWPDESRDFEVERDTLKIYNPSHAYCNGRRAIVLTMVFHAAT